MPEKPGKYLIVRGRTAPASKKSVAPQPQRKGGMEEALLEYLGASSPQQKPPTTRPTQPPPKKAEAPRFEDTLTQIPSTQPPSRTLYDELFGCVPGEIVGYALRQTPASPLSDTEKQLLTKRVKDPVLVKQLVDPLNAAVARRLLEAIRWETRMVEKLEEHGFPKGLPEPSFFLPFGGPAHGKTDFLTRFRALETLAFEDSANRAWRTPVELRKIRDEGLKRILAHRVGKDAAKKFDDLPAHAKEEVLEATKRYEELRHLLHEKGFDKSLPITLGLSEALDVLPTPLSEHLPELDRQLETLYKMRALPRKELEHYASYAKRITTGRE